MTACDIVPVSHQSSLRGPGSVRQINSRFAKESFACFVSDFDFFRGMWVRKSALQSRQRYPECRHTTTGLGLKPFSSTATSTNSWPPSPARALPGLAVAPRSQLRA